MTRQPVFAWVPAPIGWWLRGPHNKRFAHVWIGNDKQFRGFVFATEPLPRGPWPTKEIAEQELLNEVEARLKGELK